MWILNYILFAWLFATGGFIAGYAIRAKMDWQGSLLNDTDEDMIDSAKLMLYLRSKTIK